MSKDLEKWEICDPENAEDILPMPYRMIDEVLRETILYNLQLSMHQLEEKKKDQNYEGKVPEYLANSTIDIDEVCCLSSRPKYQNYLLAGDRAGQLLVIDMAKRSLSCKKELEPEKRVNFITETTVTDGESFINIIATIQQNSPLIQILLQRHGENKIYKSVEVEVGSEPSQYPVECQFEDDGRLLIVKTYLGEIHGFCLPQIRLDEQKVKAQQNMNQALVNASNSIKKPTIYPLAFANLEAAHQRISKPDFTLKFSGLQKQLKYKDLFSKLKARNKVEEQKQADPKKDSKKDPKKGANEPIQPVAANIEEQTQVNEPISEAVQSNMVNGSDCSGMYKLPKFYPFFYTIRGEVETIRKKEFQKSKDLKLSKAFIYGWSETCNFYRIDLPGTLSADYIPVFQQFLFDQQLPTEQSIVEKESQYRKRFSQFPEPQAHKTIYAISSTCVSEPGQLHIAFGMKNGSISVWNADSMTLEHNLDKHDCEVAQAHFFESWKLISGSVKGDVHIDDILENKKLIKRTNVFEAKEDIRICKIDVNVDLGLAYVTDKNSNIRVFDLWRDEKISRLSSCNNFAVVENKAKRWISFNQQSATCSSYTNRDYSVFLSIDWPSVPQSKVAEIPAQLQNKIDQLRQNPWVSPQINIHVLRNFDFLLEHFDGIQNVYKKGYEKNKIINLFSNLEYSQLYDINFDIPDFGHAVNPNNQTLHTQKSDVMNKSSLSQQSKLTSNKTKGEKKTEEKRARLTDEVLHPEKFLLQRRKIERKEQLTNQKMIETIREEHKKKERRVNLLQSDLNKTAGGI